MSDLIFMRLALRLARRGYGTTSPNPTVGAVLVKGGKILGRGRTAPAGGPHAEIEAIRDAHSTQQNLKGATLYVTLEPCCTHGRTPPCTDAIIAAGIKRVVVAATDPNPKHAGHGFKLLQRAGIKVETGLLAEEATRLNEAFNHWIVRRTPFVTVKSAMTLDGKIATARGESKWITGEKARARGMKLRQGADAILVGVNTVVADDPRLTFRSVGNIEHRMLRRIVLDPKARTPLSAKILNDELAAWTTIVVSEKAPKRHLSELAKKVNVMVAPCVKLPNVDCQSSTRDRPSKFVNRKSQIDLLWLLRKLGTENVTSLLVEGGGETNARFLERKLVQRIAFFYAPKILCGRDASKSVAGKGIERVSEKIPLRDVEWKKLGEDLFLMARIS